MMDWQPAPNTRWGADRPWLLGILNLTPDSFFDGGQLPTVEDAVRRAVQLAGEGAHGLDVGGESTRPGAATVDEEEQIRRTVPAIRAIRRELPEIVLSIDTTRSAVVRAALDAGATVINDVSAGMDDPEMLRTGAESGAAIILMHRARPPSSDVLSYQYGSGRVAQPIEDGADVVEVVGGVLAAQYQRALSLGILPERILIDPGLGFGKTVDQNLELVRRSGELTQFVAGRVAGHGGLVAGSDEVGVPMLLSALSRKSFVGVASGLGTDSVPSQRLAGTLAMTVLHWQAGARVFRVHDVAPSAQALEVAHRLGSKLLGVDSLGPAQK